MNSTMISAPCGRLPSRVAGGFALLVAATAIAAAAEPRLRPANVFAPSMVLQRDRPAPIWGQAAPGAEVRAAFKGQSLTATADADGRWQIVLGPLTADAAPATLTLTSGTQTASIDDVLVGDVWVSAGVGFARAMTGLRNAPQEIAKATFPQVRILRPDLYGSLLPVADVPPPGRWTPVTPATVGDMSVNWYLGRELHAAAGVPVGLVLANRGSLAHEWQAWSPDPANQRQMQTLKDVAAALPADVARAESWLAWLGRRKHATDPMDLFPLPIYLPAAWSGPQPPFNHTWSAAYNATIGPIVPLAIRGVVFNADFPPLMAPSGDSFVKLVESWRAAWQRSDLPFVIPETLVTHFRADMVAGAIRAAAVVPGVRTLTPPEGTTEFTSEPYWKAVAEMAVAMPPGSTAVPAFTSWPAATPLAVDPAPAREPLEVASLFADNMVLQCDKPVKVWGWAEPGDEVRVAFAGHEAVAKASDDGRWQAVLPPLAATAEPRTLMIATSRDRREINDVVVGEVWINSGQSNSGYVHSACLGFKEEQPQADLPAIRYFKHVRTASPWPQRKDFGDWVVVSPETAGAISGMGYWFAKSLHTKKNVPVGIIEANIGGSSILLWMSDAALASSPRFAQFAAERARFLASKNASLPLATETVREWVAAARSNATLARPLPPLPIDAGPAGPLFKPLSMRGCLLYNGMIRPMIGFGVRGALWNQGEADTGQTQGPLYEDLLTAMVGDWRRSWGDDFAFYVVQMPAVKGRPGLTDMWQSQARAVAKLPNSGMIVCNDISKADAPEATAIHPPDKRSVGERLARLALVRTYGEQGMVDASPMMLAVSRNGSRAVVTFSSPGDGLHTRDGKPSDSWEIAGPDGTFVAATAEIDRDRAIVSASGVSEPRQVRLGWRADSNCNLVNSAGLPALPFTSAVAEGTTFHVAPTGDDKAAGTLAAPFRTIQRGAEAAQPGDTVLVHPGVYRERVAPPRGGLEGKPIVFRSLAAHAAIIKGSDVWKPEWTDEGNGIWSGALEESLFTDSAHVDGANPFRVHSSVTPWGRDGRPEFVRGETGDKQFSEFLRTADRDLVYALGQVFVDGAILKQVPFKKELAEAPSTWWFDATSGRLFIRFREATAGKPCRPQDHEVEITTRRRIFAPHVRGLGHIEIEGFVMEHCGNQYPADFWVKEKPQWQQAGAVGTRSGHHWRITRNVIRHANALGIDLGAEGSTETDLETPVPDHERDPKAPRHRPGYHVVEENEILDNGAAGTANYGGTHLVIRRNVLMRNNALGFTGKKRWESAGLKLHSPHDSVIEGNLIADNRGRWGLWLDGGGGERSRVIGNVVIGHEVGIDFEVGSKVSCLCANNVLIDNRVGIRFREAGGVTVAHNTILGSTVAAIDWPFDSPRPGSWNGSDVGIYNNLLAGIGQAILTAPPLDHDRYANRRFDGNLYGFAADAPAWTIKNQPLDLTAWRDALHAVNADGGCDEASVAVGPITHEFDRTTGRLIVTLPADLPHCGLKTIPGVAAADPPTDIAGQRRIPTTPQTPGVWTGLHPGENTFWVPSWQHMVPDPESASDAAADSHRPPNVLFIIADDASRHFGASYGCDWVKTPHIDRLAAEGIVFDNFYVATSKCSPSRAAILTGRNPWQLAEAANHYPTFPPQFMAFPEACSAAGIRCSAAGKVWEPGKAHMADGRPRNFGLANAPSGKDGSAGAGFAAFLAKRDQSKPFFYWFGSRRPHRNYKRDSGLAAGKQLADIDRVPAIWPDTDVVRGDMLNYAVAIESFDREVGSLIAALDAAGETANTLVVVTSDNGMPFPRIKGHTFDDAHRMPLVVRWPAGITRPGRREAALVSEIDFAPTFLELLGVDGRARGMEPITGRSFTDLLRSEPARERPFVVIGRERNNAYARPGTPSGLGYPTRGIRQGDFLYVHNFTPDRWPCGSPDLQLLDTDDGPTKQAIVKAGDGDPHWQICFGKRPADELYDLVNDPDCVRNLAPDPAMNDRMETMRRTLMEELMRQDDPRVLGRGDEFDRYESPRTRRGK